MITQKYKLPNGNTFIWLGNQPIHGCENVLILSSGDVVFLKSHCKEEGARLREDLVRLDKNAFMDKYTWPNNSSGNDLYLELRDEFNTK